MRIRMAGLVGLVVAGMVLVPGLAGPGSAQQPLTYDHLTKIQKRLLSGSASSEIDAARGAVGKQNARRAGAVEKPHGSAPFYFPRSDAGCAYRFGSNVNMDTDCQNISDADLAGRGQAQNETYISEDPQRPGRLLGSSNDYRR